MGIPTTAKPKFLLPDYALGIDTTAVTKTATYTPTALDLKSAQDRMLQCILDVTAIDFTTTDETYKLKIQQSSDNFVANTDTIIEEIDILGSTSVPFQAFENVAFLVTKRYVRFVLTLAGTTPSITFTSWIIPNNRQV